MRKSEKKHYIIYTCADDETILGEFENKKDAQAEFEKIKQTNKKQTGVFELLTAYMLPDGKLDISHISMIFNFFNPQIYCFVER